VNTLRRVVQSIAIVASSVTDMPLDSSILMFWDFYLPLVDECVVSRGFSRGEESCSLYLADPTAIIEVLSCVESLGWGLVGDILLIPCCCCIGNPSLYLVSFLTL
jgi:hypothetical protein